MPEPCLRRRFDAANELDSRIRCPLSCSLQTCPTLRHSDFHSQSHPIINRPPCRWSSAIEGISRRPKGGIAYLVRITNPVSSQASSLCKSTLISTSNDEESLKLPHSWLMGSGWPINAEHVIVLNFDRINFAHKKGFFLRNSIVVKPRRDNTKGQIFERSRNLLCSCTTRSYFAFLWSRNGYRGRSSPRWSVVTRWPPPQNFHPFLKISVCPLQDMKQLIRKITKEKIEVRIWPKLLHDCIQSFKASNANRLPAE